MKLIPSFIFLLSLVSLAKAQQTAENILPVDERGKLIYFEVVNTKVPKDSLKIRSLDFLTKQDKGLKYKATLGDTALIASGKIIISKTELVMSHPSGEVAYHFQVEVREGKYRFWLTDFVFNPYVRDRYGNFVKGVSAGIPLEFDPKIIKSEWKEYQVQTTKYAKELAAAFKVYMANKKPTDAQPTAKKVVKKEW